MHILKCFVTNLPHTDSCCLFLCSYSPSCTLPGSLSVLCRPVSDHLYGLFVSFGVSGCGEKKWIIWVCKKNINTRSQSSGCSNRKHLVCLFAVCIRIAHFFLKCCFRCCNGLISVSLPGKKKKMDEILSKLP